MLKVNILAVFQSILVFEGVRGLDTGVQKEEEKKLTFLLLYKFKFQSPNESPKSPQTSGGKISTLSAPYLAVASTH
jgi:hypothetical protein